MASASLPFLFCDDIHRRDAVSQAFLDRALAVVDLRCPATAEPENPLSDQTPTRIAIAGALGRMGRAVARCAEGREDMIVSARFERPGIADPALVSIDEALGLCDAVIDFTTPGASAALAAACADRAQAPALIIGSTGFDAEQEAVMARAAGRLTIVKAGNFSLGVNMLLGLVRQAAAALPARDWDIEVFEAHHRRKVDAPSGTALMLGEAAAAGRGVDLASHSERGRDGQTGPRAPGAIGFSVLRGGDIIGEHSVSFAADEEVLTLSHSARDRGLFAKGALAAAVWAQGKPPGLYDMQDVLGFAKP